jgi:hypothetical protein
MSGRPSHAWRPPARGLRCLAFLLQLLCCAVLLGGGAEGLSEAAGTGRRREQQTLLSEREGGGRRVEIEASTSVSSGLGLGLTTRIEDCITQLDNGWKLVDLSKFRFAKDNGAEKHKPQSPDKSTDTGGAGAGAGGGVGGDESLKDVTSKILAAAQAELSQVGGGSPPPTSSSTGGGGDGKSTKDGDAKSGRDSDGKGSGGSSSRDGGGGGDKGKDGGDKKEGEGGGGGGKDLGFTIGVGYVVTLTSHAARLQHAEAMVLKHPELKLSVLPAVQKDSMEATADWCVCVPVRL